MNALVEIALTALDDMKGQNVVLLDVKNKSNVTDHMIIVTGTSNAHTRALAENVKLEAKKKNYSILGIEGNSDGQWILVDLGELIVHVMLQEIRDFYELEKLWS